jgi:nucleoside-diphosphate-sugar epimerase
MDFSDARVLVTGEAEFVGSGRAGNITKIIRHDFQPKIERKTGLAQFMRWCNSCHLKEQRNI